MTIIPFTASGLDRAGRRRKDTAWLDAAFNSDAARVLLMKDGLPLMEGSPGQMGPRRVVWLGSQAGMLSPKAIRVFLGETPRGSPTFALELPSGFSLSSSPIAGLGVFEEFRLAAMGMSLDDASAAATARSLFEWRRRNGYCSTCGTRTELVEAGWKTSCPDCGAEHFPRVDPVAIMLAVKDGKALLGRQAAWPPRMWSALAGFVEPGETFEQAAMREIEEEAGIKCTGKVDYLFGQPWPMPHQLMIGLIVEAATDEIIVDTSELETARWFTREEAASMMAGTHPDANAPNPVAVAHHILKAWLERY